LSRNICNNLILRTFGLRDAGDDGQRNESAFFEDNDYTEAFVGLEDGSVQRQIELKEVYDLDGSIDRCVIGESYSTFASEAYGRSSYADVTLNGSGSESFLVFDPNTSLLELAKHNGGSANQRKDDEPEEFRISSYWLHNGSVMALIKGNRQGRAFIYAEPTSGIRAKGVEVGTVLFDGASADGITYTGVARTYSCGTQRYAVNGAVSEGDRSIVLKGKAPMSDQSCESLGVRDDTLVFEFLGSASDPSFTDKLKPPFGNTIGVRSHQLREMHGE
jgi:hypothetical protein